MPRIHGVSGRVQAGTDFYNVSGFEINIEQDVAASNVMSTSTTAINWEQNHPGVSRWSGSFKGWLDSSTTLEVTTNNFGVQLATATFSQGGGFTYTGTIVISSVPIVNNWDGMGEYTCNFRGSGALVPATN